MPVVGERRTILTLLMVFSISLSIVTSGIVFASSDNWSEVARLTGGGGISTTETFTCDHVDWRIRWEIEPSNRSERTAFLVYIFPSTGIHHSEPWFESIQHYGTEETSGVLYIYDHNGSFNMDVLASIESYTMIIEQNLESIPEYPSWTILPLTMIVTLVVIGFRKEMSKKRLKTD